MSETVCRACLQIIYDPVDAYDLSSKEPDSSTLTLGGKLADCVPELMKMSTLSLVLCWSCATAVRCAYEFRQQCLETEERIKSYILQADSGILTDLKQVISSISEVSELSSHMNIEQSVGEKFIEIDASIVYNSPAEAVDTSCQNNSVPESFTDIKEKKELMNNCDEYNSINLIQDNNESDTGQTQINFIEINSPTVSGNSIKYTSSPILLKKLLQDYSYFCQKCNYKTQKYSKYQIHKRVHNLPNKKEKHIII